VVLLVLASLLWAFSFGLIKTVLTGLDAGAVTAIRLALSLLLFAPLLRVRHLTLPLAARLAAIGAVQYGVMYLAYIQSFRYLAAHEVALLTIFTPLYVVLLAAAAQRRLRGRFLAAALLAMAGAAAIVGGAAGLRAGLLGFVLVQVSNLAFAFGQVRYRAVMARAGAAVRDVDGCGLGYLGGAVMAAGAWACSGCPGPAPTPVQWATLAYLGLIPSGVGFFLWNAGARRVNAGVLAAMNNLKIPLAVAASLLFFGEHANLPRLGLGAGLMAVGVWIGQRQPRLNPEP